MKLVSKKVTIDDMHEPVIQLTLDLSIEAAQTAKLAIQSGVLMEEEYQKALGEELLRFLKE